MKKQKKKFFISFLAVLMSLIMMFMFVACEGKKPGSGGGSNGGNDTTTESGDNSGSGSGDESGGSSGGNTGSGNEDSGSADGSGNEGSGSGNEGTGTNPGETPGGDSGGDTLPEEDFSDYAIDREEQFVYRLILSDLGTQYDTFVGYVTLPSVARTEEDDPQEVVGISYVDYEDAYVDAERKTYFSAGFIPLLEQHEITTNDIESGLEIISLEEEYDEEFSYVYNYKTSDLHMHCVKNNYYIKYDVVDGVLSYTKEPFLVGMTIDESRGNIFNYDTNQYVYIVEEQEYVPVDGVSLVGEAEFKIIEDEINRILRTQDANMAYEDLKTYATQNKQVLTDFLLGLQEETFIGVDVDTLVEIANRIDPMQHLRISVDADGVCKIDIIQIEKLATLDEKIVTSVVCGAAIVAGICVEIGLPVVGHQVGGAVIGAAMETFSQVVISSTPVSDIQWEKVAVATIAGALAGTANQWVSGLSIGKTRAVQVLARTAIDLTCDALIGGGEFFVNALIDGATFEEACQKFGTGALIAATISGIFKAATPVVKKIVKPIIESAPVQSLSKIANNLVQKFNKMFSKTALVKATANTKTYLDDTGNIYRKGNDLVPNNTYTINNYTYKTDGLGRVTKVQGDLYLTDRTGRKTINEAMSVIGKGDELIGDQKGHLMSDMFNGSNKFGNLVPQSAKLNQGPIKQLEKQLQSQIKAGKDVFLAIEIFYDESSFRPLGFVYKYTIDGVANMKVFKNDVTDIIGG